MSDHEPVRPLWQCGTCDEPWPCEPAKKRLRLEQPGSLAVYLGTQLTHACADLPHLDPRAAHERFLGWTRSSRAVRPAPQHRVRDAREVTHLSVTRQLRGLLAEALPLDRTLRWITTDPHDVYGLADAFAEVHARYLPAVARIYVTVAGDTVTGLIAGTHPMDQPPPGVIASYEEDLVRAAGVYANRYVIASRQHAARRPLAPHFHLLHLVVRREHQYRGLGTALLAHLHAQLDPLGVPSFTSAAPDAFVPALTRHGYQLSAGASPPDDDVPTVVGMWRAAEEFVVASSD